MKTLLKNKKINFEYFIEKEIEGGLVLEGWEVKSLINGKGSLVDSFVKEINGEMFLVGFNIQGLVNTSSHKIIDNNRFKKVLLNNKEIDYLMGSSTLKGYTILCSEIYLNDKNKVKAKIVLAKGKKLYDKRQSEKEKTMKKDSQKMIKSVNRI